MRKGRLLTGSQEVFFPKRSLFVTALTQKRRAKVGPRRSPASRNSSKMQRLGLERGGESPSQLLTLCNAHR